MKSNNLVIKTIFKDLNFKEDDTKIIASVFQKIEVKKGTILLYANEFADSEYYVVSGCLRTFYTDSNGLEM